MYGLSCAIICQAFRKPGSVNLTVPSISPCRAFSPSQKLGPRPVNTTWVDSHMSAVPNASGVTVWLAATWLSIR